MPPSFTERLVELKDLFDQGLLEQADYEQTRRTILSELASPSPNAGNAAPAPAEARTRALKLPATMAGRGNGKVRAGRGRASAGPLQAKPVECEQAVALREADGAVDMDELVKEWLEVVVIVEDYQRGHVVHVPKEHRRRIWSNRPHERINQKIRRHTDVVGNLPNRDAVTRLVGAVLCEIDDAWVRVRRSMTHELKQVETKVVGIPRRLKRAS